MNSTSPTIRLLLLPLLAMGSAVSGHPMPAIGATAATQACCLGELQSNGCATACCQAPVPRPDPSQTDPTSPPKERPGGNTGWIAATFRTADLNETHLRDASLGLPASGARSLIAQHVRLQI